MFNSFFPLRDTRSKNQKCLKWQKQTTKWFSLSVSSFFRTCRLTSQASRSWRFLTSEKAAWSSTARWSSPNQCRTTSPRPSTVSWRSSAPLPPRSCTSRSTPVLWMLNQVPRAHEHRCGMECRSTHKLKALQSCSASSEPQVSGITLHYSWCCTNRLVNLTLPSFAYKIWVT